MVQIIPGYTTEQMIITVVNNDEVMNSQIEEEAAFGWLVSSLTLSGSNVIMLFTRTVITSAT